VSEPWTWEGVIERLRARGYSVDEIIDQFDRETARERTGVNLGGSRSGEMLDWGSLHGRNRIKAMIEAAFRGDKITEGEVRAKEAELREAGQPHGADSIARALHTTSSTVRRRLKRL
jgi:hypothetical protein